MSISNKDSNCEYNNEAYIPRSLVRTYPDRFQQLMDMVHILEWTNKSIFTKKQDTKETLWKS